jgi:hypothetical protein
MGIRAFRFYVHAAINYIQSDAANGDSDFINCFAGILEHRAEYEGTELRPVAGHLAIICGYVVDRYDKFDLAAEIYGDARPRFQAMQKFFLRLAGQKK